MRHDNVEILVLWAPIQRRADAVDIGYQRRRIAGATFGDLHRKIAAVDTAHRVDDLQHRAATAVTAIERRAVTAAAQMRERRRMCARHVADVDVVADAGSVRRRVVGAEHAELGALAERSLLGATAGGHGYGGQP